LKSAAQIGPIAVAFLVALVKWARFGAPTLKRTDLLCAIGSLCIAAFFFSRGLVRARARVQRLGDAF
jgi:hypothetical protein